MKRLRSCSWTGSIISNNNKGPSWSSNYADEALAWLERSYAPRDFRLSDVASDLAFEGLRGDPRYKAFLRKMNPSSAAAKLTPQQTVAEFRFTLGSDGEESLGRSAQRSLGPTGS